MTLSATNGRVETRFLTPMIWCVILTCTFTIGLGTITSFDPAMAYAPALLILFSLFLLWYAKQKKAHLELITNSYFVILAFGIGYNWFVNAGPNGTDTFVYVVLVQIYFLVFQRSTSNWFAYFLCVFIPGLYLLNHAFPDIAQPFASEELAFWDRIITSVFLMGFAFYFSFISRKEVRKERQTVAKKQEALKEANIKIAKALEQREDFISMMSHEMKTPLTAIIGFGGILNTSEQPDSVREMGKHIYTSGKRLDLFVDQVLAYSDIQRSNHRWHRQNTNVRLLIDRALNQYKVTSNIPDSILISIEDQVPEEIQLDEQKTIMILNVFVSNAEKFGHGQAVDCLIGYDSGNKQLQIEVRDLGPGIPEDKLLQVLEPFHQLDRGSTRKHEGAGLGLSIAKAYAECAGGSLEFKNLNPQGLSASAFIPLS